jgi:thiosulfate/3-mercaptopyruvate sulfurtransferase
MPYVRPEALVGTDWLAERLDDPNIAVIDASWHRPATKRDAAAEFTEAHIPGARFFDIDQIADRSVNLPHMVPDERTFAEQVGALGISNRHHVIAYDVNGGAGAAMRAWWMFRLFGHARVSLLAGGFGKWKAEGRPVQSGAPSPRRAQFMARLDRRLLRTLDQVRANIGGSSEQLVDVRSARR